MKAADEAAVADAVFMIRARLASEAEELLTFAENVRNDAAYALEWSDRPFLLAARARVARFFLSIAEGKGGLEAALAKARDEALRAARFPSHSTSLPSNLMSQYEGQAWAEMFVDYGGSK